MSEIFFVFFVAANHLGAKHYMYYWLPVVGSLRKFKLLERSSNEIG